ncbi:MAG: hypothetical protein LUH03_03775 [Oscillospiraceae bacterium]|nr:hypothetical protein [Oscillospiraceae bacterium]
MIEVYETKHETPACSIDGKEYEAILLRAYRAGAIEQKFQIIQYCMNVLEPYNKITVEHTE